jgi:hypothetical protein
MKARRIILSAILGFTVLASAAAEPASGQDAGAAQEGSEQEGKARISAGVSVDYALWSPIWGRVKQTGDMLVYMLLNQAGPFMKIERPSRAYSVDPALLWGAHVDAELMKGWGISAGLIIGPDYNASVMVTSLTTNPFIPAEYIKYKVDSFTFDSQVLAHYRFAPWFRLSFGPAYQGYTFKEQNSSYLSSASQKESVHMIGFKAGGRFTIRLVENLFILPDISFQTLYGFTAGSSSFSQRKHPIAVGVYAVIPFSYYVEKIRVAFSLGFRYQFLHYVQMSNEDYVNRKDHRYGITESITYTF